MLGSESRSPDPEGTQQRRGKVSRVEAQKGRKEVSTRKKGAHGSEDNTQVNESVVSEPPPGRDAYVA